MPLTPTPPGQLFKVASGTAAIDGSASPSKTAEAPNDQTYEIRRLSLCNTHTSTVTVRLFLGASTATPATADYILKDAPIMSKETLFIDHIVLIPGAALWLTASTASVVAYNTFVESLK